MMQAFAALAALLAMAVGSGIGFRLIRVAQRTQGVPERLMGSAFLAMFALGYPCAFASRAPGVVGTPVGVALFGMGLLAIIGAIGCFYSFTWRVFRPEAPWARGLLIGAALGGCLTFAGTIHALWGVSGREAVVIALRPWAFAILLLCLIPFAWSAIESGLYYRVMRRRQALGLAEPITTNRFLLWALAATLACVLVLVLAAFRAAGVPILSAAPTLFSAFGMTGTISLWYFAFAPPLWYQRRLAQAGASAG